MNFFAGYFPLQTGLRCLLIAASTLLVACATVAPDDVSTDAPKPTPDIEWVATSLSGDASKTWQHRSFPGKKATFYRTVRADGRDTIQGESSGSASMLRQHVRVEPGKLGQLRFSWKVPQLITGADLTQRETDDSPVRLVLAFEGDRSLFSPKNAMLSELALLLTGEPLPYATLMYVWGNHREPGSVIINPRTDRIRKVVVESGPRQLGRWLDYERDIRADYEKAFGEAPGALVGIALMTDTDNTHQKALAWYGPVTLVGPGNAASRPVPQRFTAPSIQD